MYLGLVTILLSWPGQVWGEQTSPYTPQILQDIPALTPVLRAGGNMASTATTGTHSTWTGLLQRAFATTNKAILLLLQQKKQMCSLTSGQERRRQLECSGLVGLTKTRREHGGGLTEAHKVHQLV